MDFDELGVEATVDLVRRRWQGLCDFHQITVMKPWDLKLRAATKCVFRC